jgi:protein-glutamine gamma-glutamyltransferase
MANLSLRPKRPQLTADELQQLRWLLGGVLTVLGVATVLFMDVDAWLLLGATAIAAVTTTFSPTLPARVPKIVHMLAFPLIAAFFAADLWLRSELLPAMVRLDMLLLLYRALVYRQRRDDLQVIVLGLFLVVVAGVLTVSLAFAAQILAYTACSLTFLFVIHLADATPSGSATGAPSPSGGRTAGEVSPSGSAVKASNARQPPAWATHADWRHLGRRVAAVVDWRVLALAGVLFVGMVAVTAVLFLAIPRFQLENGMFLDRFITKKARTGFSDSIKFGDVSDIQQDTGVALHVDVSDPHQIPATPYWRMLVLNEYRNGTFRMSAGLRNEEFDRERSGMGMTGLLRPRPNRATWTFYLEPGVSRYLPLLGSFQRLRFGEAQNYQQAARMAVVALTKDPVTMTAYQVDGFDFTVPLRDRPARHYGDLPPPVNDKSPTAETDQVSTLRRLLREAGADGKLSAAEFSGRVCAWLRDRHIYSLSPRIPDGPGDPLVRWADSRGPGHCELFAGSFVLLARAAGYPARIVTGFRGGTWNAFSNSFTVRNSDAHAWAEIFDRDGGMWLRADPLELPTATQSTDASADAALARRTDRSWAARLDSLRVFWYRRIVSFDQQAQVNTVKAAKEVTQNALRHLRERLVALGTSVRAWWVAPWDAGRIGSVITLSLAAAALTWLWRWSRLQLMSLFRPARRRDDPIRREAGRWLQRLMATTREPADRIQVMADLQRIRFGARQTWPDATLVFRRARKAARR